MISIHKESATNPSPPVTSSTAQTVTSCDYSTATTTSGYMSSNASSLPYDSVMPGPSGSYLPYSPVMYSYQPHPHPMSMRFSTGIGDIRVQSPTQWSAPHLITLILTLRLSFVFASVQEISVFATGAERSSTRRQSRRIICVCSMKSGAPIYHLRRICQTRDLEMRIIMQTQHALWANGPHFTHNHWWSLKRSKINCKWITNHFFLSFWYLPLTFWWHDVHCNPG